MHNQIIYPRSVDRFGKVFGIQYLRFLCAGLVVLSHCNGFLEFPQYFSKAPLPSLHSASLFSVATFFSISGYIIAMCSLDTTEHPHQPLRTFLRRRALRILPFFWACTIAYNALSWVGNGNANAATMFRTMMLWPLGELRPNVAWSLRHELVFYLLFATCLLPIRRGWTGRRWLLIGLWCLAPLFWNLFPVSIRRNELLRFLLAGGDNGANLQFGAGLLVGIIHIHRPAWLKPVPRLNLWHLCLLFAICATIAQISDISSDLLRAALWTVLAAILITVGACTVSRPTMADDAALAIGNSSFSLYLMHNTVMLAILSLTTRLHLQLHDTLSLGAYLAFCVLVSIFTCHLIYLWIERPLVRYAQKVT